MTYRIEIERKAMAGIDAATAWYAENASPAVAGRWYRGLMRTIGTLRAMPRRCPRAVEDETHPEELRVLLHGKRGGTYRILFTIRDDAVCVLSVRHAAQG